MELKIVQKFKICYPNQIKIARATSLLNKVFIYVRF